MKLDSKPSYKKTIKDSSKKYAYYLLTFLFLFLLYPSLKTILDLSMLLSTGRITGTEDWVAPTYEHKERLAEAIPSDQRRILIVGGSSSLFGISAQQISEETGLTAINLATHAGLGGDYILRRAEKLIRPGDIVVLPIEHAMYLRSDFAYDFRTRDTLSRFVISYDRTMLSQLPLSAISGFIFENAFSMGAFSDASKRQYQAFLSGNLTRELIDRRLQARAKDGECYSGSTFNEYGDELCTVGKDNNPTKPNVARVQLPPSLNNVDSSGHIKRFVEQVQAKGATVVPLYPAVVYMKDYENPAFQRSIDNIVAYWENQGIEFQDTWEASLFPVEMMYDTAAHLKDIGRRQRTESIIQILKDHIASHQDTKLTKDGL